jgi:hypothetical protein
MKVSHLALTAFAVVALSACNSRNANQNAATNIRDAAENRADMIESRASNVVDAAQNQADALRNQADQVRDVAENRADRVEAAPSGGGARTADTNGM